ncbi:perlucin-like protein [Patiria miniata]|uniref:C-type lectin domain-containing protein n=1 Tax=Patiria miniata TaxID=46514 RepID=A0A914A205_PATMI|nr:perlucin-like protein [Patiria miniata]
MSRLLLLAFFLATIAAIVSAECPGGYTQRENGGNCYKVWHDFHWYRYAMSACEDEGGWLVTIRNAEDQAWVNNFYKQRQGHCHDDYWIGANDLQDEGHFRWLQDNSDVTWAVWRWGEPNDSSGEDCVNNNLYWNAWNDAGYEWQTYCFVCEMFPKSC